MSASLPTLNFLTDSVEYTDYRPAVGPAGDIVIFERTLLGGGLTTLYQITDFSSPDPVVFLAGQSLPPSQTRPDWCWKTDKIAFNGALTNQSTVRVWQVGIDRASAQPINATEGCSCPTWSRNGSLLVAENSGMSASPRPCNSIFDTSGTMIAVNIDGYDSAQVPVFGGMPTVGPNDLPQIAFAGQPAVAGWGEPNLEVAQYNQDKNYIFLNTATGGVYTSTPMEAGASVTTYDPKFQGRAPAWSPDGTTIVFESNRSGQGYAIYLYNLASGALTQVTDPALGAQHAKFFPCGSKLILCVRHPGANPKTMGIAWVDISELLKL
jgi:Tol biopolymer transport system component